MYLFAALMLYSCLGQLLVLMICEKEMILSNQQTMACGVIPS